MIEDSKQLVLIPHTYEGAVIHHRSGDGYINATAMCKAAGREFKHYNENKNTRAFIAELSSVVGIPTTELIQSFSGGNPSLQGTWVHPQVAINLAQWVSPAFAVKVSEWVVEWMSGLPASASVWKQFEDRVSLIYDNVPLGYFCVFKESADIFAALIMGGATFGTRMIIDISVGLTWAAFWKENNLATIYGERQYFDHNYPKYFPQSLSNPQSASCYPDEAIPVFRKWMRDIYMPTKLPAYLQSQVQAKRIPAPIAADAIGALKAREQARALPRPTK